MTYIANPKHYSREDFAAYIGGLTWSKGWTPALQKHFGNYARAQ